MPTLYSDLPSDLRAGALSMLPIALSAMPFGMLFGAEAARQGLSTPEATLMSMAVFAGGAQFMAMGLWSEPAPWAALALAVFVVNLRHVLMAASLSGRMTGFGPWGRAGAAFLLADETWALAERRALAGGLTPGYYLGIGLTLYALWAVSTVIGAQLGGLIADPERWGIDFAFPAIFICLVLGFARDWRAVPVIAVSAAVALAVQQIAGGSWFVIAGGLAGMAVAAALAPRVAAA